MKIIKLLNIIKNIAIKNNISNPVICGGVVRELSFNKIFNIYKNIKLDDVDITTGNSDVKNLAKEVEIELSKHFKITSKTMDDNHTSIFLGKGENALKIDFSSNFVLPNIDQELKKIGVKNPTPMIKEAYSRDFTVNSMTMDFNLKKINDPTGKGLEDIKNKIIRTCLSPEITLTSNINRLVRVIYLAAKLDFNIDKPIIDFISNHKELFSKIDPGYLSRTLNKAIEYNADKTASILDILGLWKTLPLTDKLYPYYEKRFIKTAQLRKNFDYGEGFYANLQDEKSVSQFRKKRKKKQKKQIKKIKDMKIKAFFNGTVDYMNDNFPILLNDDLQSSMDRPQNKIDEDEKDDDKDNGAEELEPASNENSPYSSQIGFEGLNSFPLVGAPGTFNTDDDGNVVNNLHNPIYQPNGLLASKSLKEITDLFVKLAHKKTY